MTRAETGTGAIDVHTHIVPAGFPDYAGCHAGVPWPSMRHTDSCHASVVIAGKEFRKIDERCWNPERRIEAMDEAGIVRQVLSPMPELLSHWMAAEDAAAMADHVNGTIAEMVAAVPDRFVGLGMVPLQDIDMAVAALERIVGAWGFAGVEIGTHVDGVPLGHPLLDPFFAAAEDLGAAVFVHALRPVGRERIVGPSQLANALTFPCEVALAASSMLTGGLVERHPHLRVAFSHGGGAFALLLPRLSHCWQTLPAIRETMTRDPRELARQLYYDTLVYDADTLAFLLGAFGTGKLFLGSDYPFRIHDPDPAGRLDALDLDPMDRQRLLRDNAAGFLGLEEEK